MATLRVGLDTIGVNPRERGGHHREIEMIGHGMGVTCLATGAADFLLNFLKSGFNFPPRAVDFDDLLEREIEIGRKESEPSVFSEDPDDAHRAAEIFEHQPLIIGHHNPLFAVERDRDGTCQRSILASQVRGTA